VSAPEKLPQASVGSRVLGWFLALPRKMQLAIVVLVAGAVGRVTGVDATVLEAVLSQFAVEEQAPAAPAQEAGPQPETVTQPGPVLPDRKCESHMEEK